MALVPYSWEMARFLPIMFHKMIALLLVGLLTGGNVAKVDGGLD